MIERDMEISIEKALQLGKKLLRIFLEDRIIRVLFVFTVSSVLLLLCSRGLFLAALTKMTNLKPRLDVWFPDGFLVTMIGEIPSAFQSAIFILLPVLGIYHYACNRGLQSWTFLKKVKNLPGSALFLFILPYFPIFFLLNRKWPQLFLLFVGAAFYRRFLMQAHDVGEDLIKTHAKAGVLVLKSATAAYHLLLAIGCMFGFLAVADYGLYRGRVCDSFVFGSITMHDDLSHTGWLVFQTPSLITIREMTAQGIYQDIDLSTNQLLSSVDLRRLDQNLEEQKKAAFRKCYE